MNISEDCRCCASVFKWLGGACAGLSTKRCGPACAPAGDDGQCRGQRTGSGHLPGLRATAGCRLDVIAVGTGQALAIAARGDADVVIVHARKQEDAFLAAGHARQRHEIMYNDFVVVGPANDPARGARRRRRPRRFAPLPRPGAVLQPRRQKRHATKNWPSGPPPGGAGQGRKTGIIRWAWARGRSSWLPTRRTLTRSPTAVPGSPCRPSYRSCASWSAAGVRKTTKTWSW